MTATTTYSNILPHETQLELIALRDRVTTDSFRLGDICEEVIGYCTANKIIATKEDIYSAVGAFSGKKTRTIREFHHLSRLIVPEYRETYSVLAIDHFRTAATYGDRWQEMLEWAISEVDRLGRPATVESMEIHFSRQPEQPEIIDTTPLTWVTETQITEDSTKTVYQPQEQSIQNRNDRVYAFAYTVKRLHTEVTEIGEFDENDKMLIDASFNTIESVLEKRRLVVDKL